MTVFQHSDPHNTTCWTGLPLPAELPMMLSQGYHVPGGALQCQSWGDYDKAFLLEENI